jgi:hypothetical protein
VSPKKNLENVAMRIGLQGCNWSPPGYTAISTNAFGKVIDE